MFKAQKIFRGLLLTAAIFAAGCMNNSGTEIPNGASGVTGRLTDANGNPVSGAVVQMVPVNYVPSLTLGKVAGTMLDTTDAKGYYWIPIKDTGVYNIDSHKDTLGVFIDSVRIPDNSNSVQLPDHKMKKLGSIKGISNMPGQNDTNQVRVTLYIPGTGRITKPVIGGAFAFADVPAGTYQIIIDPTLNTYNVKTINVTVAAGATVNLDTVKLSNGLDAWTIQPSGTFNTLTSIAWTGHQLVAVGDKGTILASQDGITWVTRNSGTTKRLNDIIWTGSELVAAGNSVILISPDGITWTSIIADVGSNNVSGVAWTGSKLVAIGDQFSIVSSPDGGNWAYYSQPPTYSPKGVAWDGNQLIAACDSGSLGTIKTSPDGGNWTKRNLPTPYSLNAITWMENKLVALGSQGTILTSSDGIIWKQQTSGSSNALRGAVLTADKTVVVGDNGTVLTSSDGTNWIPMASLTGNTLNAAAWTGSRLVIVGFSGTIMTSP